MGQDKPPRVSIGLPVYNGEKYIEQTIDSILAQTFKDFELVVSDNASTDRTEEICRAYAAKDSRVRYYRNQTNLGAAWNYNRVLELARGEYFKWTGHDDIIAPTYLERCVAVLDREPFVVLCYPRSKHIDAQGNHIDKDYLDDFNFQSPKVNERFKLYIDRFFVKFNPKCNQAFAMMRTEVIRKVGGLGNYDSADMIMLGELLLRGPFYEVPEQLFYRRVHPESAYSANRTTFARAIWFDPKNKGKIGILRWKWLREYLAAIKRVPMTRDERLHCYLQMVRWFFIYGISRMAYDVFVLIRRLTSQPKELKASKEGAV